MSADGTKVLIYLAGTSWDGVVGTDRRLASSIADSIPVFWVDPPVPVVHILRQLPKRRGKTHVGFDQVAPNICRLRSLGAPGLTRPFMRSLTSANTSRAIRRLVRVTGARVVATVVATPEGRFPRAVAGRRVYFVTDDWTSGADMMGLSRRRIERRAALNFRDCDVLAAVTPDLLEMVRKPHGSPAPVTLLLPNGCVPPPREWSAPERAVDVPNVPFALLVGQINERLDIELLNAVVDRGIPLVVVGPRTERDATTAIGLDRLFARSSVHWLGSRTADELAGYLAAASVGLTPYRDNAFNRASFPLKTLEYLAAGLPVVATDLPAVRWLNTDLVAVARSCQDFAELAHAAIVRKDGVHGSAATLRRDFAKSHSWRARAASLLQAL